MYILPRFSFNNEEAADAKKTTKPLGGVQGESGLCGPEGRKTLAQLASEHDVHVNQIQAWRNQLKDNMVSLFGSGADQRKGMIREVKAFTGEDRGLTMENDFLAKVLEPESGRAQGQDQFDSFCGGQPPMPDSVNQPLQRLLPPPGVG